MAPVASPPRTWWGWDRGQVQGPSPACLSPERIQGRLQGAPLSTEGKAEATEPEAALAGAAPAPSHPPLPEHDTLRQPRPELGREAPSCTHQLCTEGAAETPRVGAQPGVVEQGPQAAVSPPSPLSCTSTAGTWHVSRAGKACAFQWVAETFHGLFWDLLALR